MTDWIIEPLGQAHERTSFSCGKQPLDDFIRARVSQYERRRIGKTFVAVRSGEKRVVGYYTLAAGAVAFEHLPAIHSRKVPKHPVPVVLLARLAVDQSARGIRLGEGLLLDALHRTCELPTNPGVHAVTVDALDDEAASFYLKYGFIPLSGQPLRLFLPITTIESVLFRS